MWIFSTQKRLTGIGLLLGCIFLGSQMPDTALAAWYFVGPQGSNTNFGRSPHAPLASIQQAMDWAMPGDTVVLLPGEYKQDARSVRDGLPDAPIRIQGTRDAVMKGAGHSHVFHLAHSYIELAGFTIDGHHGPGDGPDDYRDKLLYANGEVSGITGLRIIGMAFRNGGGECLRLKGGACRNEIAFSSFDTCGIHDFRFETKRKNGEAIYIGTAPEQLSESKTLDTSSQNHIHDNIIHTHGSECIELKEGAIHNLIEHNICQDVVEPESGGISARSNFNTIRFNTVGPTKCAGIRVGGDTASEGIYNKIYGNQLQYNEGGALKLMRLPQESVCGNDIFQPEEYPVVRFPKGESIELPSECPQYLYR